MSTENRCKRLMARVVEQLIVSILPLGERARYAAVELMTLDGEHDLHPTDRDVREHWGRLRFVARRLSTAPDHSCPLDDREVRLFLGGVAGFAAAVFASPESW